MTRQQGSIRMGLWGFALLVVTLGAVGGRVPVAWAVVTPLTNGGSVSGTVAHNNFRDFSLVVPSGATLLTVTITNATGDDVDLFVNFGSVPALSMFTDDCISDGLTGNEACQFSNPTAGTWFITVFGTGPGAALPFTLTATYQTGGPGPGTTTALTNGVPVNGTVQFDFFTDYSIVVPAGATQLTVTTTNASGDVDLYVRFGQLPELNAWDCRPFIDGGNETCQISNPQAGTWFISVYGFASGTHSFTVTATYQTGGPGPGPGTASAFVTRLYQTVLLREPDAAGLAAHLQNIQQFGTVIPTVVAFFKSPEFLSQSLSDTQFLDRLYHTFLNRAPDPAGLAAFLGLLNSGCRTRETLIADLTFSPEFEALLPPITPADPRVPFVAELYAWILNRPADLPGLQSFVSQLQRSTVLSTVLGFLHSAEFTTPRRSATDYVSALYLVTLGRAPDCGGLQSFVAALNQQGDTDAARDQLLTQFAASAEFQAKLDQLFPPGPPPPPPPPGGGISGVYTSSGTATATSACGPGIPTIPISAFALTITQTGSTFTGSGTATGSLSGISFTAAITLSNGTVSPTNQLSGSLALTITLSGVPTPIPVSGTFTGSVLGNTLTINGTGTLPADLGAPPGCGFNVSLTGTRP